MYTLDDLAKAKDELERWNDAFANDSSNNPNKYAAQRRDAGSKVRRITELLKLSGIIEKTEEEKLNDELDGLYPNAAAKSVVSHNGCKYQIRYFPLVQSRSRKTVKEWGHKWVAINTTN
ncbi:hypothetical protein [Janthinobacterium agaricidamnosum]|uniref:hypothetical protein n=1 Tax=Janthinobacterium agaricidamnosum TaxID=55508 RepID=UPI00056E2976|nr:hypothetical protein [Janthinobacterium agaricidamnosum]